MTVLDLTASPPVEILTDYRYQSQATSLGSPQPWTPDSGAVVVVTSSAQPVVAMVDVGTQQGVTLGSGFQAATSPRGDVAAFHDFDAGLTFTTGAGTHRGRIGPVGSTVPTFSGDGTRTVTSTGSQALVCPVVPATTADCQAVSFPDGFTGTASLSTNADYLVGIGRSGIQVLDVASEQPHLITSGDQRTIASVSLPTYCPAPGSPDPLTDLATYASCS